MGTIRILVIVMIISLAMAAFWNSLPIVKQGVHYLLDPSAGRLLEFNVNLGMIIISALITLFITLIQKFTVDNETLRQLKKEQRMLSEEVKKFRDNPEKMMELIKKSMAKAGEMMNLSMGSFMYTAIPIILFFRWFNDYFTVLGKIKIFGFLSWFWAYLIFSIIFSMIFRKILKLP